MTNTNPNPLPDVPTPWAGVLVLLVGMLVNAAAAFHIGLPADFSGLFLSTLDFGFVVAGLLLHWSGSATAKKAFVNRLKATGRLHILPFIGAFTIVSMLLGCSLIGTNGAITSTDLIGFNTAGSAVKASMDVVISTCVKNDLLGATCTNNKGAIKAGSQALDTLFDQGLVLIQSNGTSSALEALLSGIAGDVASYEQIVTDLDGQAAVKSGKKKITPTQVIQIAGIAITVIEDVWQAFQGVNTSTPPSTTTIASLVASIDADNAAIQAW